MEAQNLGIQGNQIIGEQNSSFYRVPANKCRRILELEYHYFVIHNEINGSSLGNTHQRLPGPLDIRLMRSFTMDESG